MPQIQVLDREPDQSTGIIQSGMQNLANTIQERKRLEMYKVQLDAMKRNTDSEIEKMKYERMKQFVSDAIKLKEIGGGDEAFQALSKVYGDDTIPYMADLGKAMGGFETKGDVLEEAIARKLNGAGGGATTQVGVGMDGQPDMNPRVGPMAGGAQPGVLIPKVTTKGVEMVFPEDTARAAEITKAAQNRADIATRNLGSEEQKSAANIDLLLRNTREAVANLSGLQVDKSGVKRKLDLGQTLAIDNGRPEVAGADVEPLQSNINQLKSVLLYLRSGVAVTPSEYERLSRLLQLTGKEPGQQVKDIEEFQKWAEIYLKAMQTGAPALKDVGEKNIFSVGRFSVKVKE